MWESREIGRNISRGNTRKVSWNFFRAVPVAITEGSDVGFLKAIS